jgi:hypothetical protein
MKILYQVAYKATQSSEAPYSARHASGIAVGMDDPMRIEFKWRISQNVRSGRCSYSLKSEYFWHRSNGRAHHRLSALHVAM